MAQSPNRALIEAITISMISSGDRVEAGGRCVVPQIFLFELLTRPPVAAIFAIEGVYEKCGRNGVRLQASKE